MAGWDRRQFLFGVGGVLLGCAHAGETSAASIRQIEQEIGGRVGVAALDIRSGKTISYRANERFAMCSTFKWLLAAAVLAQRGRGELTLADKFSYSAADLLVYSPVTSAHIAEGALSIEALCAAAVEVSDNAAANLLLRKIGGPAALTAFLRGRGDQVTRLDRTEPSLNTNLPGDPRDTTTPAAMVQTMRRLLVEDGLAAFDRHQLLVWLKNCRTGADRLRAGLPANWASGDKTGSGPNGAANDVAIAWPPGRAPLLIASYLTGSSASGDALNEAHAEIAALAVTALT